MSVLVLLVGMNPLPNWVVFKSLLHASPNDQLKPDKVLLVHSHDNVDTASELQERIRLLHVPVVRIPLDNARDRNDVRAKILKGYSDHAGGHRIHLNYTGGTKEMVVSAYAATKQAEEHSSDAALFSYLDVSCHSLRWYSNGDGGMSVDLRTVVHVGLAELLALHRRELDREPPSLPTWPNAADAVFRQYAEGGDGKEAYRLWRWREFIANGTQEVPERLSDLDGSLLPGNKLRNRRVIRLPLDEHLRNFREAFAQDAGISPNAAEVSWNHFFSPGANGDSKSKEAREVAKYFHGTWLENWLWRELDRLIGDRPGWQLTGNVEAHRHNVAVPPAELDVVLIIGYQLFVFSCTTALSRDLTKNKGFEVLRRSQQFGGDESHAVLVTLLPYESPGQDASVRSLRQDLVDDGGGEGNLAIWGMHELTHLDEAVETLLAGALR